MQLKNTSKRARTFLFCAIVLLTIFLILQARRPAPAPPPLAGTYQYFVETDFHSTTKRFGAVSHCDARFAPKVQLEINEIRQSLTALLKSYAALMDDLDIETWIAHGALLGWYWNRKLLPWDTDLDVQVSAESIAFLAKSHNMTEYRYPVSEGEAPRTYLLDLNPHYNIVSRQDVANKIDGRWIDTTTGKFIDITAVHRDKSDRVKEKSGRLFCKDGHQYKVGFLLQLIVSKLFLMLYQETDIYPLQPSFLEATRINVPTESEKILQEEYGKRALTNDRFHW